jgi:hypothetical protein
MTKSQIEVVLADLGYDFNQNIKMPEVSSIYLTTDNVIYPSNNTRLNFCDENGSALLLVYEGYEKEDGTFIASRNYPNEIVSFDTIAGFTLVSDRHKFEPFKVTKAV